jgi:hypothetical protein
MGGARQEVDEEERDRVGGWLNGFIVIEALEELRREGKVK